MSYLCKIHDVLAARYPDAAGAVWAGSTARGEGRTHSDIDLVILKPHLTAPWRETFTQDGQLFEVFVQDELSLSYFLNADRKRGRPSLMHMLAEGRCVLNSAAERAAQARATEMLSAGPPDWTQEQVDAMRYAAVGVLDDLRDARDAAEARILGAELLSLAVTILRRGQGRWDVRGRYIAKTLLAEEGRLGAKLLAAFDTLFATGQSAEALEAVREVLALLGGPKHGYYQKGPKTR